MKKLGKQQTKNKFGQYFTPEIVADFMIGLANLMPDSKILEPSCGQGVFLDLFQKKGFENITAYEIDTELATKFSNVRYESFVTANIKEKYDLIIGNPPYIRWKNLEDNLKQELATNPLWNKYCNSLCDYLYIFILKSIELLNDNGQLIFVCPEYWMNTTHSISLRNYMVANGYFEIDWLLENDKLSCKNAHFGCLFNANPANLYINWAAAMQIQFHVCDLDQTFKGTREQWAREYLKHFITQAKKRADDMIKKFVKPFEKYIK